MRYIEGNARYYICGVPGNYAIKATGNNRIVIRDILTLQEARNWLTG
jgi:hypothetical protein